MDQKTLGIIATITAVLLCGFPGLALLCLGGFGVAGTLIPDAQLDDPRTALIGSLMILCVGVLMVLVPVGVIFFIQRNRKTSASAEIIDYEEPLPPAI